MSKTWFDQMMIDPDIKREYDIMVKMPKLIQRMDSRIPVDMERKGVDRYFVMDYMGSAEFEFGALPKALKAMRASHLLSEPKRIKHPKGHVVWYVGPESDFATASEFFFSQLKDPYAIPLQESTWIADKFGYSRVGRQPHEVDTIGWWAIDRTWALFTRKEYAAQWLSCM